MKAFIKSHRWSLLLIIAAFLITTLPFVSKTPFNWDAAQFTLGVEHYSVQMHQPHPPGYPLFIGVAKVFSLVLSPHSSVLAVSLLFGLGTVVVLYILAWYLWTERSLALVVSLGFICNPLFWLYRETALTYTVDTFAVSIVLLLTYFHFYHFNPDYRERYMYVSGGVLALLAGFRPSLFILLLPVIVFQWVMFWFKNKQWFPILISAIITLIFYLLWFIPLLSIVGGWHEYNTISKDLYKASASGTSVFYGAPWSITLIQMRLLVLTIMSSLNVFLLPLVGSFYLALYWYAYKRKFKPPVLLWAGLCAVAMPLIIYNLIHFGQIGYALIFLPVAYIACIPALRWLLRHANDWQRYVVWLGVVVAIMINASVFLMLRPNYSHPEFVAHNRLEFLLQKIAHKTDTPFKMNAALITQSDDRLLSLEAVAQEYDPENTVIIATRNLLYTAKNGLPVRNDEIFRELSVELPQFTVIQLGNKYERYLFSEQYKMTNVPSTTVMVPDTTRYILFAINQIPAAESPNGMFIERRTIGDEPYYLGIMEKPFTFLGFTVQRDKDKR